MENNALTVNDENSALIAEMVALRSGLSVISQKVDEIKAIADSVSWREQKIVDEYNSIAFSYSSMMGSLCSDKDFFYSLPQIVINGHNCYVSRSYDLYNIRNDSSNKNPFYLQTTVSHPCSVFLPYYDEENEYYNHEFSNGEKPWEEFMSTNLVFNTEQSDKALTTIFETHQNNLEKLRKKEEEIKERRKNIVIKIESLEKKKAQLEAELNNIKKPTERDKKDPYNSYPRKRTKEPTENSFIINGAISVAFIILTVSMGLRRNEYGANIVFWLSIIASVISFVLFISKFYQKRKYQNEQRQESIHLVEEKAYKEKVDKITQKIKAVDREIWSESLEICKIDNTELSPLEEKIGAAIKLRDEAYATLDYYKIDKDNYRESFRERVAKFEEMKQEKNQEILSLRTEMKEIAKECEKIEEGLHENFDSIIVENDWQNIDLIIFQMTSGRADSYKESLQLVDRLRQTEAIVNAVENASEAICGSLKSGFKNLGGLLTQSFERLSTNIALHIDRATNAVSGQLGAGLSALGSKIDRNTAAVGDYMESSTAALNEMQSTNARLQSGMSELVSQNKELASETRQLISATELNNALQEKANESSDRLYHDLRYTDFIIPRN